MAALKKFFKEEWAKLTVEQLDMTEQSDWTKDIAQVTALEMFNNMSYVPRVLLINYNNCWSQHGLL